MWTSYLSKIEIIRGQNSTDRYLTDVHARGGELYEVEDVARLICRQCGEVYLEAEFGQLIDKIKFDSVVETLECCWASGAVDFENTNPRAPILRETGCQLHCMFREANSFHFRHEAGSDQTLSRRPLHARRGLWARRPSGGHRAAPRDAGPGARVLRYPSRSRSQPYDPRPDAR